MDARNIVIAYLKRNGFDGLCKDGCGCGLDDFAPCGEDISECFPAKEVPCNGNCSGCLTDPHDRISKCYKRADINESEETRL